MRVAPLPVEAYRSLVAGALAEDIGSGDATSALTLDPEQRARGTLIAKSALVLSGLDVCAGTGAREQIAARVGRMPHADVSVFVEHAVMRQDPVGNDEVVDRALKPRH